MPVGFWGDEDGSRYHSAYFEDIPGVWRHGDWVTVTSRGSLVITGRSDATLNRGGVRLGTSEFYRVVEELPEVKDSLVVHLEDQVVRALPRTLSGKKLEVPVKKILRGAPPEDVVASGALDDPSALADIAAYAASRG